MEPSATMKLELGLQRLAKAGTDADMLGLALQSIHGALEDTFRSQLAADTHVPEAQRTDFLDPKKVQWRDLLDAMMLYRDLSQADRNLIWRTNGTRTRVAHGGRFSGSRADVEAYAALAQRLCGYTPPGPAATPAAPRPRPPAAPAKAQPGRQPAPTAAPAILPAIRSRPAPQQRSPIGWLAIAGVSLLLLALALITLVRNAALVPLLAVQPAAATAGLATLAPPSPAPVGTSMPPRVATVRADGGLHIRATPQETAPLLFTADDGTQVTVVDGPVNGTLHTWWYVDVGGRQGWCAGEYLSFGQAP